MRNKEGYVDSTAGKAINNAENDQQLKPITSPVRKKHEKKEGEKKKLVYCIVPVYTSK